MVSVGIFCAYIASYAAVTFAILPVQNAFLPYLPKSVCLVFLPSGVKMLSIIVFGEAALPALLMASLFCDHVFWGIDDINLLGALTLCGVGVYYLVIQFSSRMGINVYVTKNVSEGLRYRQILLLGMLASSFLGILAALINGSLPSTVLESFTPYQNGGVLALMYVVGDTIGLLSCGAIVWGVSKWIRTDMT